MSQQTVCDNCHEPVDLTQPFIRASVHKVFTAEDGTLTVAPDGITQTFDFHEDCAPSSIKLTTPEAA